MDDEVCRQVRVGWVEHLPNCPADHCYCSDCQFDCFLSEWKRELTARVLALYDSWGERWREHNSRDEARLRALLARTSSKSSDSETEP